MTRTSSTIVHRVGMLAWVLALPCWATLPVQAQETGQRRDRSPRVEVGGQLGSLVHAGEATRAFFGAGVRLTVNLTSRDAIELTTDVLLTPMPGGGVYGLYFAQYKRVLGDHVSGGHAFFVTAAVGGGFYYDRFRERRWQRPDGSVVVYPAYTRAELSKPVVAAGGVGIERVLARYAAARAEIQAFIFAGIGLRAVAGISIPIGRYREQ